MTESSVSTQRGVVPSHRAPCNQRELWSLCGDAPGPTTVFIACMHGNEPAARQALQRIKTQLDNADAPMAGRVVAIIGNVRACETNQRFVDDDLNRLFRFTPGPQPQLHIASDTESVEYAEAVDLLAALQLIIDDTPPDQSVNVVDLHTFSGKGAPFLVLSDTLRNRRLAKCWPLPMVLGLAESLQGTLIDYLTACGCVCAVVETGQHDDPRSVDLHESVIRCALQHAGHIAAADARADADALARASEHAPNVVDVQDRYGIAPGELFTMCPGFANFDRVRRGEHLADSNGQPVYAKRDGRMLLPLYQEQGEDGYFIARPIGRFWMRLSGLLRRLGISRFVSMLPGVRRHPTVAGALLVDRNVARWLAVDVFHLLGYRLIRERDEALIVSRHAWDLRAPDKIVLDVPPSASRG